MQLLLWLGLSEYEGLCVGLPGPLREFSAEWLPIGQPIVRLHVGSWPCAIALWLALTKLSAENCVWAGTSSVVVIGKSINLWPDNSAPLPLDYHQVQLNLNASPQIWPTFDLIGGRCLIGSPSWIWITLKMHCSKNHAIMPTSLVMFALGLTNSLAIWAKWGLLPHGWPFTKMKLGPLSFTNFNEGSSLLSYR